MLGIKFKWECPSCGTIIATKEPFNTKKLRKVAVLEEPIKCSCGRKTGFTVIDFEKFDFNL